MRFWMRRSFAFTQSRRALGAEQRLANGIRGRLNLTYRRMKRTIGLNYRDRDPVRAAEVVNTLARFFGEEDIVSLAATPSSHVDCVAVGVVGGLLGGLSVLLGRLGRVAVERFAGGH